MLTCRCMGSRWCSHNDQTLIPPTTTNWPLARDSVKHVATEEPSGRMKALHQDATRPGVPVSPSRVGSSPRAISSSPIRSVILA